jgi:hypothetical protein
MSKQLIIPERLSSLLPEDRIKKIKEKQQRCTSHSSIISMESIASTTVSDFLEEKIVSHQLDIEYLKSYKDGLHDAYLTKKISKDDFNKELSDIVKQFEPFSNEIRVLKRQRKIIREDLEDEIRDSKKQNANLEPPIRFLERAYTSTIVPKVMAASAKQKRSTFNQSEFRREVVKYYGATKTDRSGTYCHLTGWWDNKDVKAAHLVPKSLSREETTYLFGASEPLEYMPQNSKYSINTQGLVGIKIICSY